MRRRAFITGLTILGVACLALAVWSYWRPFVIDLSKAPPHQFPPPAIGPQGNDTNLLMERWLVGTIIDGSVTVSFSLTDEPPNGVIAASQRIDIIQWARYLETSARYVSELQVETGRWYGSLSDRLQHQAAPIVDPLTPAELALRADRRASLSMSMHAALASRVFFFGDSTKSRRQFIVRAPLLIGVPLLLLWPLLALVRGPVRRAVRRRRGACLQCGYNLTGNTSGVCPECGEPIPLVVTDPINEQQSGA